MLIHLNSAAFSWQFAILLLPARHTPIAIMLTLVIADKNISSWSLRPWLLLKHLGLPFSEVKLQLNTPQFKAQLRQFSPAGRVPVLIDGDLPVWDSLAIAEYLNELSGGRGWPTGRAARAHARSISAEMHSGFAALRTHWPMNATGSNIQVTLPAAGLDDVARIDHIWQDCQSRYRAQGPWLFGEFSIADAMYAPVVLRFNTYGATLSAVAAAYCQHVLNDSHLREWLQESASETDTSP